MHGVATDIARQLVFVSVEAEAPSGDAVGVASDDGAEMRVAGLVARDVTRTEDDIGPGSLAVGRIDPADHAAIIEDVDTQARSGEPVSSDGAPILRSSEGLSCHAGIRFTRDDS